MGNATQDRNTPRRESKIAGYPVLSGQLMLVGTFAFLSRAGAAIGKVANSLAAAGMSSPSVVGVVTERADATTTDAICTVRRDEFFFMNSGTAACAAAHLNTPVFAEDNQTVRNNSDTNTKPRAGILREITANGCWVQVDGIA